MKLSLETKLMYFVLALGVSLLALAATVRAETWIVTSEDNFPPYNYTEDGKRAGLDVEIVGLVLARLGVDADHQAVPWNRVVAAVDNDQTDLAFQFVGTPARFEKYNMVGPHRVGSTVFVVPADSALTFETVENLRDKRVGTVSGFTYAPEFDKADFIVKDAANDNTLSVRKLLGGRVDAIIGDRDTLRFIVRKEGGIGKVKFLPKALVEAERFIAFPKARKDKADRFAAALIQARDAGEIDALFKKWSAGA